MFAINLTHDGPLPGTHIRTNHVPVLNGQTLVLRGQIELVSGLEEGRYVNIQGFPLCIGYDAVAIGANAGGGVRVPQVDPKVLGIRLWGVGRKTTFLFGQLR